MFDPENNIFDQVLTRFSSTVLHKFYINKHDAPNVKYKWGNF